ncbi:hypothetical protein H2200_008871 [Cladophialophora chaetospira]|uniref:Uncharacterized protein n=1 Tax=Cladophialophora chaetospira TaxID=386627 RepID=A0AA38X4W4_9EURO|nr:hypothetical protein H2200_008871 [Cladophialophora chaetospira]
MTKSTAQKLKKWEQQNNTAKKADDKLSQTNKESIILRLAEAKYKELTLELEEYPHHCRTKDGKKGHDPCERCLKLKHMGWCPSCEYLSHPDWGCHNCGKKKEQLFYSTRDLAWHLARKAYNASNTGASAGNDVAGEAA